jgi:nucleoid-associated protein YgaU
MSRGEPYIDANGGLRRSYMRIIPPKPQHTLDLYLTGPILPLDESYGGFEADPRDNQVDLLSYPGARPMAQSAPVLLDGTLAGRPIDTEWDLLESFARRTSGNRPPRLTLQGPLRHKNLVYVLDGLQLTSDENSPKSDASRRLIRWAGTLIFREDQLSDLADQRSPTAAEKKADTPKLFKVTKAYDTYRKIAKQALGDRKKWKAIAKANNDSNPHPDRELTIGATIRLPS